MKNRAAVNQFTQEVALQEQFFGEMADNSSGYVITEEELRMVAGGQVVVNTV